MKRVLIVAYYFPPVGAVASLRALGFCRYLQEYGWLPRVLTAEPSSVPPWHSRDEDLCTWVPTALPIDRIPHGNPQQALIRTRNKLRDRLTRLLSRGDHLAYAKAKAHEKEKLQRVAQSTRWKDFILEWAFSFPDPECSWFRSAVRKLHLPLSDYPDVVFATGGPWTCLLVGQTLARRLQVPFVADFRDPWTANPYYALPSRFLFRKARRLERALCDAAARVIANTEELRRRFAFDYPDFAHKFVTITNGYNSDVSAPSIRDQEASDEAGLELSYFGTLYGNGNPLPLLQAVMELVEANGLRSDQFRLRFVGSWDIVDDRCERLARRLEKQGFLRREPPVPHHLCLEQMRRANVLLIMQPHSPLQTPAKTYEYISTGRPILVLGGEGATANLIEKYRLGKCCPNTVSDIKTLLRCLITKDLQIQPPRLEDTARFQYRNLTRELADVLEAACTEHCSSA